MARFCGVVGYVTTEQTAPGVWTEVNTERKYYGDVVKYGTRRDSADTINDNIRINCDISIMADPYAYQHFSEIKYVEYAGTKWNVTSALPERPRILLTLGGVFNGQ